MAKVRILVVCGSGVATSMHVVYKLREYFEKEKDAQRLLMAQVITNSRAGLAVMTLF